MAYLPGLGRLDGDEMTRTCPGCKRTFPVTSEYFIRKKARPDGFTTMCRACLAERQQIHLQQSSEAWEAHPENRIVERAIVRPKMDCFRCAEMELCKDRVMAGQQVMCAPTRIHDLLLERAYQARTA